MTSFFILIPIFLVAYFLNEPLFWLHWVGFAKLCSLYQERRRKNFLKDFLLPCWGVFLTVYAVCFYWVLIRGPQMYAVPVLSLSPVFPVFFLTHHLLTSKIRSPLAEVAAAFGIFFLLESLMSHVPAMESIGLDFFFLPPTGILCVLKYIHFKVWSAWVFAACLATSCRIGEAKRRPWLLWGVLVGSLAVLIAYAVIRSRDPGNVSGRTVRVALVQHNLPYLEGWRRRHYDEIKKKYRELALKASWGSPDLVVFPLYNLPDDVYRDPAFLEELVRMAKCPVLIASHVPIEAGDEFFSKGLLSLAFLYAPGGKMMDIYQAVETPPFYYHHAEKADKYRVIQGPFGKLGVLLCYEDMVPRLTRAAVRDGARVLIALSNPGLFAHTAIIYYELIQDQIRAAEAGLPLLRLSPNGFSAYIDHTGRIVQRTKLNTEDILHVELSDMGPDGPADDKSQSPLIQEMRRPARN